MRKLALITFRKIYQEIFCALNLDVDNETHENTVRVYALSQGRASLDVLVLPLSHKGAKQSELQREPYRAICRALRIS
jgi:hypothetical protein